MRSQVAAPRGSSADRLSRLQEPPVADAAAGSADPMTLALGYSTFWSVAHVCDGWPAWIVFPFGRDAALDRAWQEAHLAQEYPV